MLPETAKFQETVGIINGVDVAKFPAVLTRLIKKLHTQVCALPLPTLERPSSRPPRRWFAR